jgi:hypothetical protein
VWAAAATFWSPDQGGNGTVRIERTKGRTRPGSACDWCGNAAGLGVVTTRRQPPDEWFGNARVGDDNSKVKQRDLGATCGSNKKRRNGGQSGRWKYVTTPHFLNVHLKFVVRSEQCRLSCKKSSNKNKEKKRTNRGPLMDTCEICRSDYPP